MTEPRLDSLPQELIDQIASDTVVRVDDQDAPPFTRYYKLDKLADLASLSRTCKRLSIACAPILFRRVILRGSYAKVLRFLQCLIRNPQLAEFVRVFKTRGWDWGMRETADIEAAEGILESDPAANRLLQEGDMRLWDMVTVLALKLLPDLVALTTTHDVMRLLLHWPQEQRLRGSSISALSIVHEEYGGRDNYCEDMFEWKQAFRSGNLPTALQSLYLEHYNCQPSTLQSNHIHRQLDLESLRIAASLRRLYLQGWLSSIDDDDGRDECLIKQMGMLDRCTSLTHLIFIDGIASTKAMLNLVSKSTTLTSNLRKFEIQMRCAEDALDKHTLAQLSKFTHVTSLTLPWIDIDGDTSLDSMVWPPSLESLTLSIILYMDTISHETSLQTVIKPSHFPASMQYITFKWFISERDVQYVGVGNILDLIDLSRALHRKFASSVVALLHQHCSSEKSYCSTPTSTYRDIERD